MKKKIALISVSLIGAACISFCACSGYDDGKFGDASMPPEFFEPNGNYDYNEIVEQGFKTTEKNPSSYFSLDRNTATYSLVRRQINSGWTISPDSVRIEEMINYFSYDFASPADDKAVAVSSYLAPCPWNAENMLMLAGVKTSEYNLEADACNYVFLMDVSGSMSGDDRLGLAKKGIYKLLDNLGDNSVVSLVTYANGVDTHLDGVECTESGKTTITNKVKDLTANGGTNGGDGLERAYRLASKHFITGGNNRVILISDGDFNVGMTAQDELKEFIQDKAQSGFQIHATQKNRAGIACPVCSLYAL